MVKSKKAHPYIYEWALFEQNNYLPPNLGVVFGVLFGVVF